MDLVRSYSVGDVRGELIVRFFLKNGHNTAYSNCRLLLAHLGVKCIRGIVA